jgi:alpha-glucosidase
MGIPMLLNLGMSGFAFCGTDVGGFGSDCTPELLARWSQFGAFTPLFRNHSASGTRRQEPWTFDETTLDAYRNSVLFRYQLIPYLYDLFYEASETGLPVLRPLVMEHENDVNTYEINDEVMLGSSILGAFVTEQGQRKKMVYLPGADEWYDYHTKKAYQPGYHIVDAPLNKVIAFVKKGSIIPQSPVRQYIEEEDTLILDIYPGVGSYVHYQDNGEDFKNQDGEYNLYHIYHEDNLVRISLLYEGYKTYKKVILKYLDTEIEVEDYQKEIVIE